jgi:glyceraldehyde 3-phosphate dehydrogenase
MIGINGFGRIGRLILRSAYENNKGVTISAINDPMMTVPTLRYLLQYDSAHLRFPFHVEPTENGIIVNGQKIRLYNETDPTKIPWGQHGITTVMECTGKFLTTEKAKAHLGGGAKKVIISAPPKDDTPLFVYGVNHNDYKADLSVVSNASCTTNCLAPIAKVLHDNFTITEGLMTTVHAATASQAVVDQAVKPGSSFRGGRATGVNIVPYSTGAAKALGKVITSLKGKVTGMSFRVPTVNVSVVDFTFKTEKACSYADISNAMKRESEGALKGVLGYTEDEIVSTDVLHDPRSSVFDQQAGISLNSNFHKVVSWYDNEWGYSNRMIDLAKHIHKVSGI